MTSSLTIGARLGLALLAAGIAVPPVQAQSAQDEGASSELSRHLVALARNPNSLGALMGAGKASLEAGDPQAALTFFGRAEELAPRDGRIKMLIGAALVQLEQPRSALRFFQEASRLGISDAELGAERGLAHDMLGDFRLAQADYQAALRQGYNAETTRRLALSLAIGGERERALQLLETQLMVRDKAAERARAFILALTGDAAGAARATEQAMPPAQAQAMTSFMRRLPALSAADRAMAVHFGHFPGDGRMQVAQATPQVPYTGPAQNPAGSSTLNAGRPDQRQAALGSGARPSASAATPRAGSGTPAAATPRPGTGTAASATPRAGSAGTTTAAAGPRVTGRGEPAPRDTERERATPRSQPLSPILLARNARPVTPNRTTSGPQQQGTQPVAAEPRATTTQQPAATSQPQSQPQVQAQPQALSPLLQSPPPSAQPQAETAQPQTLLPTNFALTQQPGQAAASSAATTQPQTPPPAAADARPVEIAQAQPVPQPQRQSQPSPQSRPEPEPSGLADIAATVAALSPEEEARRAAPKPAPATAAPKPAQGTAKPRPATPSAADPKAAARKAAAEKAAAEKRAAEKAAAREPSRIWVQIAGGADRKALPREFTRLKAKAPKLFAARTPWITPANATNRLLVGPFKTDREAQEFVNALRKEDVSAFAWTSAEGQKIDKLAAK